MHVGCARSTRNAAEAYYSAPLYSGKTGRSPSAQQFSDDQFTGRTLGRVSTGSITAITIDNRASCHLTGQVSLDKNGGFVQMAFDLNSDDTPWDASHWTGIELDVHGNGEAYEVRLRTCQLSKPWQSFRAVFQTSRNWNTVRVQFCDFAPHRHDLAFDPAHLRRIGVLAIGREFQAAVAVSALLLYR